jgi:predicted nucleic acid-binding protein
LIVVDTNIVIYFLTESEFTDTTVDVRRRDQDWVAPYLWRSEIRNVLMGYLRRGSLDLSKAVELLELAERKVESRHVDGAHVIELALASGCTAYDCEFVSLAMGLQVPLVTSDKKLLAAFPDIAVSMKAFVA